MATACRKRPADNPAARTTSSPAYHTDTRCWSLATQTPDSYRFAYSRHQGDVRRPLIKIQLRQEGRTRYSVPAVIDTGSDRCMFDHELAISIGMNPYQDGMEQEAVGIGGREPIAVAPIELVVPAFDDRSWPVPGGFSRSSRSCRMERRRSWAMAGFWDECAQPSPGASNSSDSKSNSTDAQAPPFTSSPLQPFHPPLPLQLGSGFGVFGPLSGSAGFAM